MATIETRKSARGLTYRVKVRLDGKPPASRTFTRLAAAKAWAAASETEMRNGQFALGGGRTLAAAISAFLATELEGKKDVRMLAARALWWQRELGKVRLRDLSAGHVAEKLNQLEATKSPPRKVGGSSPPRSPATVNRYRAAISAVLTWAEKQDPPWITGNPARKTKHRREIAGRTRFLTPEERGRLLAEAKCSGSSDLYLAVALSLATGGRQGEIMGLSWPDIDMQRALVVFRDTKNGDTRIVPLPTDAIELLRERRKVVRLDSALIFPSGKDPHKPVDLRSGFRAIVRRAEITGFRWHDMRHSAASALADLGANLLDTGAVLGHRSQQTTRRYAHLTEARLRDLIDQAAQKHRVS
jgi:integrase